MQIHYDIANLPKLRNAVVTIGTFDGVHMGHRQIIDKLKKEAAAINGETVIITFDPHPRKVVSSTILGIRLINTPDEKLELFEALGLDHIVIVAFTAAFANQTAEEYIADFLVKNFNPHTIIIGYDHRFGRDRLGNYQLLEKNAAAYNYCLLEIPRHILENISISSTNIREAVLHNDIDTANTLLGYEFFFSGIVVHGDKIGRQLGFPTANLKVADLEKIIPSDGIYAVQAYIGNDKSRKLKGMMSIGFRPTVNGTNRVIEVNFFDFDQEIYGETVTVYVKKFLRQQIKFDDLAALTLQIKQDKINSLALL